MRISLLNRYILSEIIPSFIVNILVLTSIMLMAKVMDLASLVISRGAELGMVMEIFMLVTPKILSLTIPMATLLAILTAFLRLSADSELTVLRASGISLYQMSPPVIVFSLLVSLITATLSLWVVPETNWRFQNQLLDLAKARADLAIVEQTFIYDFPGLTLYVGQLSPTSNLMGQVFIHDNRNPKEDTIIVAQSGQLGVDRDGGSLLLSLDEGVIDRTYQDRKNTDSIFFDNYELKISSGTKPGDEDEQGAYRRLADMPTHQLQAAAEGVEAGSAFNIKALLEFNRRWSLPFSTFIMALIGLPLGASFRVRGNNFAMVMGMGVFITYYALSTLGFSLAKSHILSPFLAAWLANIILAIFGVFLFKRINRGVPIDPIESIRRLWHGTGKPRSTSRVKG